MKTSLSGLRDDRVTLDGGALGSELEIIQNKAILDKRRKLSSVYMIIGLQFTIIREK